MNHTKISPLSPKHYWCRLLLIDGAPGALLWNEISNFLEKGFNVTVSIGNISNSDDLKEFFQDKISYTKFDKTRKSALIEEIRRGNLGYDIIKLRLGPSIDEEVISSVVSSELQYKLKIIAQAGVGVDHIDCSAATKYGYM